MAAINAYGISRGLSCGTATVTAASGAISGSSNVTVSCSDLAGNWNFHLLTSGDSPQWLGWTHGVMDIDSNGSFNATVINRSDGDSTNLRECQLGTNPHNPDTDGDGMPDGWEAAHSLNPADNGTIRPDNGATGDPDLDGVDNISEFKCNQDPHRVNLVEVVVNPETTTVSIGGSNSYEVIVRNTRLLPDTLSITLVCPYAVCLR